MNADDAYEEKNDRTSGDAPSGDVVSKDYVESGPLPVQPDDAPVEDPIDPNVADSDKQLGTGSTFFLFVNSFPRVQWLILWNVERDDKEAIDKSNILKGSRTRHAKPQGPGYSEGPDEDDLPKSVADGTDGTSAISTKAL